MSHLLRLTSFVLFLSSLPVMATEAVTVFTSSEIKLKDKKVIVQVLEGNFDDTGKAIKGEVVNRQFAFGLITDPQNPGKQIRQPIKGFMDEGGSPVKILDIFPAVFDKSAGTMIAILTEWDSRTAGGHKVMERSGIFYDVLAFDITSSSNSFHEFKSKVVSKFSSCDCLLFTVQDNGLPKQTGKEKAFAKTKAEVLKRLQSM